MNEMPAELAAQIEEFLKNPSSGVKRERPSRRVQLSETVEDSAKIINEFRDSLESTAERNLFDLFASYVKGLSATDSAQRNVLVLALSNQMWELERDALHDVVFTALSRIFMLESGVKALIDATEQMIAHHDSKE